MRICKIAMPLNDGFDATVEKYEFGNSGYVFRGTANKAEVRQIIRSGKMLPSSDTIAGDPVLQEEYGIDEHSAPDWAYTSGVNLTDNIWNATGYGAYVIVIDISKSNDVWKATEDHLMATVEGTRPVAILDMDDRKIVWVAK